MDDQERERFWSRPDVAEHIARFVAEAPPLSPEQRQRIAALLAPYAEPPAAPEPDHDPDQGPTQGGVTISNQDVRTAVVARLAHTHGLEPAESRAVFGKWLDALLARAWDQGWNAGTDDQERWSSPDDEWPGPNRNPYR